MANLKTRIATLEQAKGERIEIVRIGTDGIARTNDGKTLEPGWEKSEKVITIVRSYGVQPSK